MQKAIQLAKQISKSLDSDFSELVEDNNLHKQFEPIYNLKLSNTLTNTLICAIIYAYDVDSKWADLKKSSHDDKVLILKGLNAEINEPIFDEFIKLKNEEINNCIGNFLDVQGNWKIAQIRRSRDYHSEAMMRQTSNDSEVKEQENIGKLLREGLHQIKVAEDFMKEIEASYVALDHRTKQDFGTSYSEFVTHKNPLSWREFIQGLNEAKLKT